MKPVRAGRRLVPPGFALLALVTGCAPRPAAVATIDPDALLRRYVTRLAAREARVGGTIADVSLWLETPATGRLPGAHATLGLGGDAAARLRVEGAFGPALDVAAAGDSVFAWVPSRNTVVRAAAADPPLAFPEIAAFAVRVAAAAWRAPAAAWPGSRLEDSLRVLEWTEGGDSLALGIGASGLPRSMRRVRPGMGTLRVTYPVYEVVDGAAWPTRIELADASGRLDLKLRVRRLSHAPATDPARFRAEMPADAALLPVTEVLEWFQEALRP